MHVTFKIFEGLNGQWLRKETKTWNERVAKSSKCLRAKPIFYQSKFYDHVVFYEKFFLLNSFTNAGLIANYVSLFLCCDTRVQAVDVGIVEIAV